MACLFPVGTTIVAAKLSHKIAPDAISHDEIWWKDVSPVMQGLHVSLFQIEMGPSADDAPQWGLDMKRIISTMLAAGMALSVAGAAQAATETKPKKEPTAAQLAARERLTKCSAEWKEAKAGGKVETGTKWPKFWSACNKRLKEGTKA